MNLNCALALLDQPPLRWALLICCNPQPPFELAGLIPPIAWQSNNTAGPSMSPEQAYKVLSGLCCRGLEKAAQGFQALQRFETSEQSHSNRRPAVLTMPRVVRSSSSSAKAWAAIPRDIS